MSQQNIDFGTFPDDPDADAIRTAFQKVQNNFTELFSTSSAGQVVSINRAPGAGIQVNSPTGNVIVTANIACVQVATSSLSIGQGGNGGTSATITQSSQTLVVDINPANVFSNNFAAVGGGLANLTGTLTAAASAQPNITSTGTLTSLAVTANITAGNIFANSGTIKGTLLTGTLTTAAQPNITGLGTLGNLSVTGNSNLGNLATANYFSGDGGLLSNLSVSAGSNLINGSSNIVVNASGNVTTSVAGNANVIVATGTGVNVAGYLTATQDVTADKLISTVATGTAPFTVTSTTQVANLSVATAGLATYATTANSVAGSNVSGTVANATNSSAVLNNVQITGTYYPTFISSTANGNYTLASNTAISANLANGALIATTFVGNIQGNISGNITVSGSNTQVLFNDSGNANATAGFTFDKVTNIVSITGNVISANANLGNSVTANYFIGSGNNLSNIQGANVNGAVTYATTANSVAGSNVSGAVAYATTANSVAGANVSGTVANATYAVSSGSATTAATVTTNAQPNITSVGTLSSLTVTGNVNTGNTSATNYTGTTSNITGQYITTIATGTAPFVVTSTTQVANLSVATANTANTATTAATVTTNAQPNITSLGTLSSLSVTGNVTSGNANLGNSVTANYFIGNFYGTANSATTAATVTNNAQPNITSVGTLSSLAVTSNITSGNVYANSGTIKGNYFIGDGGGLSNINIAAGSSIVNGNSNVLVTANGNVLTSVAGNANVMIVTGTGANITGTLNVTANANAGNVGATGGYFTTIAGSLTTAAQPNITSLGTLTGLTSNGTVNFANAANVNLGSNSNVRISGGTSGFFLQTDGSGNLAWTNAALVPVPGANTQVIFNNAGAYGSNTNFTYNPALSTLTVPNITATLTAGPQTGINAVGTLSTLIVSGNISAANISGGNTVSANFLTGTLTTASQPNITSIGTLSSLTVTGNISGANITGTHYGAGTGLTSIPGANVTGTVANATYAVSSGSTTTAGTVTTNAQPNITSVGTLSSLIVSGTINAGNLSTGGTLTVNGTGVSSINGNLNMNSKYVVSVSDPVNAQDAATKNYVDTLVSTGIAYHTAVTAATTTTLAITTGGTTAYNSPNGAANGIGAYISTTGSFNLIDTANVQTIGTRILVKDEANSAWNGVYTWANATAIVRATDADTYGPNGTNDLSENDYFFVNSGSVNRGTAWVVTTSGTIVFGTTAITFSQFSSSQTYSAGTGLTLTSTTFSVNASQTQITSVGTLGSLAVTANANVGALYASGAVQGSTLTSNVATGTAPITVTSTTLVPNLYVARANVSDYSTITTATTGNYYLNFVNALTGNVIEYANSIYVANIANGSLTATTFVGALSGAATTASTVTNPAQPNITSVGTLTSLTSSGNITTTGNVTGTHYGAGTGLTAIPGANVTGTVANATYATTAGTATTATSAVTAATVTNNAQPNITSVGTLTGVTMAAGSSISGGNSVSATFLTGTLTTAAQPNITSVGTLTSLSVTGNISGGNISTTGIITGNGSGITNINGSNVTGTVANATYAVSAGSATTAGTVTTGAQPNITSVGTLTGLGVNGNISAVNITATIGVFTGNGSGLTSITGANVTGTVPSATSATTAGTVTTGAQPNITSVGTLTSLVSTGNIQGSSIISTGYVIRSVGTGITAAGSTQGTATPLSKEINIVSTVSSAQGVQLPTAVAGMVLTVTNTSANSLLVYPAASSYINTQAINVGFVQPAGATIQFIAPTTTQWYTVGGTYA